MDARPPSRPWDRLLEETESAYRNFLFYRNLGPGRTLHKAYLAHMEASDKATHGDTKVSGQWKDQSRDHAWVDRADAWDVYNLQAIGKKTAAAAAVYFERLVLRLLEGLETFDPQLMTFGDHCKAVETIKGIITPETIAALVRQQGESNGGERGLVESGEPGRCPDD